ncbi:MAG TPA: class F sortase [Patescibacteria group bacterium]
MKYLTVPFFIIVGILLGYLASKNNIKSLFVSGQMKDVKTSAAITQAPTIIPAADPKILSIPKLGIEAPIEEVGMDASGAMDIPQKANDTAWYKLGPKPGQMGSAVIDGHVDWYSGPAVFFRLNELNINDIVRVTAADGKKYTFRITDKKRFDDKNFPIAEVFTKNDAKRLNLITCVGTFDKKTKNYSQRLVIFSVLVEGADQ